MDFHGKNFGAAGNVHIETQINQFATGKIALPNTIPAIPGFVGREEYLKELREAYQNDTRCFVLHGIGGVGKTALALQFAGEIGGDFETKILVEMQGLSEKPYSWREAMFEIVRQFEPQIPVEIPDARLKGLFIQFVQNQKTLIVLDNAANKESVETLKQANACFITTSRESFTLTGGKSFAIRKMLPEDARKLLFEIADENRFEGRADELAELAGYIPMALKPLASILAEDELETAGDLIERYGNKRELLKERVPDYEDLTIEASFELSYEKLSDELKQNWRRLSVFTADFIEFAIERVLDISQDKAHETQKQLRRYNLLEVNPETKRFSLHDLARVFTNEKLSADERFQSQFKHAQYYLLILYFTDQIRANNRDSGYAAALRFMDFEWINISTGQKWAADNAEKDEQIAELCCVYSIKDLISLRLHPQELIVWLTAALTAAKKFNNKMREGNILQNLGNAYTNLGNYPKAIEYHEKALEIARNLSYRKGEGQCLGSLGGIYQSTGEYRKAIDYYGQSLVISREIGDHLGESNSLGNLGIAYTGLGEYQKASGYHELSLIIRRGLGDRLGEGAAFGSLGAVYQKLGEYQRAIKYHQHHLAISREIGSRIDEGKSLGNLGIAYNSLGEYQKAIEYQEQSLKIKREIGDRLGESQSLGNLGVVYAELGEYRKAIEYHEQHLAISREIGSGIGEGTSLSNLGNAYFKLGESERGCVLWRQALSILERIESPYADEVRRNIEKYCGI